MSQTPVTGIRLDDAMEHRFKTAVSRTGMKRADLHRNLLHIALHCLENEGYNADRALLRAMLGRPSTDYLPAEDAKPILKVAEEPTTYRVEKKSM